MHRLLISAILLTLFCCQAVGGSRAEQPKLLGTFDADDSDPLNMIYRVGSILQPNFDVHEDRFAVRVCSDDSLPVALAMASGLPFVTTLKLEKLGIPKSRMYYLRYSKNCQARVLDYALTEYWLIPKDAEFPPFDESTRASNLSGKKLTVAGTLGKEEPFEVGEVQLLTPDSYRGVLETVVRQLKENRTALVVIQVHYYKRSRTLELKSRVRETEKYLRSNGIAGHRIHVKRIYSGISPASDQYEPKYPDIVIVGED